MLGHNDLVEQGGREYVHVGEPREIGQVVLVGSEVVDGIDAAQKDSDQVAVAGVALVEVCSPSQVRWPPVPVDRPGQCVQHGDLVSQRQQPVARVRADEAGSAGDEDPHERRCTRRSPGIRASSGRQIQNTVVDIASALIATGGCMCQGMHHGLAQARQCRSSCSRLDADLGQALAAPRRSPHGNGSEPLVTGPGERADNIGRTA